MKAVARALSILIFVGIVASLLGQMDPQVDLANAAAPTPTPATSRRLTIPVEFTWYDWWLVRWSDNQVLCRILVEHEGTPTQAEVRASCGNSMADGWINTPICNLAETGSCRGLYIHFVRSFPGKRNVDVYLPQPQVWVSLADCNPAPTVNRCTNVPSLQFTGEEKLANEAIIRIQGTLAGESFSCQGEVCILPLRPTGTQGVALEFWGDSSFGDSTPHYKATVRVTALGDFMNPDAQVSSDEPQWAVDVISSQWHDGILASCSDVWEVLPEVGGPPAWLNTPIKLEDMLSTRSYYYLAGQLIANGEVYPIDCPNGGMASPMVANQCGLERALPKVQEWQNRFDAEILKVAKDTGVPAQLMKNIFGRESQFWPGLYANIQEAGLGQLTEKGADTVLLWNPSFYQQFCPLILSRETCQKGFVYLKEDEQNLLRGGLVSKVNAACPTCPVGIDLTQAEFSVRVFAESLLANCSQTGRIVTNVTGKSPGLTTSYIDMWKFTLVNYNAGPGCLWAGLKAAYKPNEPLTWAKVSTQFDPVCQAAVSYVDAIAGGQTVTPTPTAWVFVGTPLPPPLYPTAPPSTPTRGTTSPSITPGGPTATRTATITPGGPTFTPTATPTRTPTSGTATRTSTAGVSTGPPPSRTPTLSGYPANPTATQGSSYP